MGSKRFQTVVLLLLLAVAFAFYVQWSSRSDPSSGGGQTADRLSR
jgi:hypothetical protein